MLSTLILLISPAKGLTLLLVSRMFVEVGVMGNATIRESICFTPTDNKTENTKIEFFQLKNETVRKEQLKPLTMCILKFEVLA